MSLLSFPRDFLWGTATAAHHVEGQNFNCDWWDWEQIPGRIKNGDSSRVACDWWNGRYIEDFDRAQSLGTNAHRLSVEWSRLEPREGEQDAGALAFYRRELEALHERGMIPLVTLHHFTSPRWLAADGGWENPQVIGRFARFARYVVSELKDLCDFWVTINEPNILAYQGYASGNFPPGVKDVRRAFHVMVNETRAHAGAYYAIKDVQPQARVGLAYHFRPFYPQRTGSRRDRLTSFLRDRSFNWPILRAVEEGRLLPPLGAGQSLPEVRGTQDFIGVNYYYTDHVKFDLRNSGELFGRTQLTPFSEGLKDLFSSVGNIEPAGIEKTLLRVARYGKPIYITENGVIAADDLQSRYLVAHLAAVDRAIQAGADVRGYFWWTLIDNFEWTEGYSARFGLYHLDVTTQVRTPRPVAETYARIIRENGIGDELVAQNKTDFA